MSEPVCLECWARFGTSPGADPLHLDCTGEHFVSKAEADEAREWINGRYEFMVRTGQRQSTPGDGAVV